MQARRGFSVRKKVLRTADRGARRSPDTVELRIHHQVFARCQTFRQIDIGRREVDTGEHLIAMAQHVCAQYFQRPGSGNKQPQDHRYRCCLAGTVATEQADNIALAHFKIQNRLARFSTLIAKLGITGNMGCSAPRRQPISTVSRSCDCCLQYRFTLSRNRLHSRVTSR